MKRLKDLNARTHTVQIALLDTEPGKKFTMDSRKSGGIRHGKMGDKEVLYLRFNPNKGETVSRLTGEKEELGDCKSLADFELHVADWAAHEEIPLDSIRFTRVDFAIDCPKEGADYFRKLSDALILEFNVKHKTKNKDQFYGGTQTTMVHKINLARRGEFEFNCYNKEEQKEESGGIVWRLEFRYIQGESDCNSGMTSILPMLQELQTEVRSLLAYYKEALVSMNEGLINTYHKLQAESDSKISLNSFIHMNNDRVFSREQLEGLYILNNTNNPKEAVRRYCKRHKNHILITEKELDEFTEMICFHIGKWVTDDPFLVDFFNVRKATKPCK